ELLQQLLVAAHGQSRADQRVDLVALDVLRPDPVDAPAPVEHPRAVLDQVDRGGDVGGDAGVGVALDYHLEARPGAVQRLQEAAVAAAPVMRGEDAGHRAAVVVRALGVAGIQAGAPVRAAVAQIVGEVGRVEVDVALDHADTHWRGRHRLLLGWYASAVVVDRVGEAVGRPLVLVGALRHLALAFLGLLRRRFLDYHRVHTGLAT